MTPAVWADVKPDAVSVYDIHGTRTFAELNANANRVVRLLRETINPVVVVAAPEQDVPPLPADVAIVRDQAPLNA